MTTSQQTKHESRIKELTKWCTSNSGRLGYQAAAAKLCQHLITAEKHRTLTRDEALRAYGYDAVVSRFGK